MKSKYTPNTESDILKSLQKIDDDPASFDVFIDTWNSIFDFGQPSENSKFDRVEAAALSAVSSMNEVAPNTSVGRRVGHLLEQFESPAYLVRERGTIIAQNTAAVRVFGLGPSETLDDLPFDLERDESITEVVRSSLHPGRNFKDAVLKRAYSTVDDTTATLSIAPAKPTEDTGGEALVFVIDARWKTAAAGLLKREFDLSTTEQELLIGFLDGQTTQSMSDTRNRSHATIRTQFHSLMGKMGAHSQTELLRNALSVSQFVDQIDEISEVIRHPHRKRVDLVRPGGRSVEVTMAGALDGMPIVFMQSGISYTFESSVEKAFHDAGICVLSVCRPGFGDTDPPLPDNQSNDTFEADLNGLLDQLGHDDCLLMSSDLSSAVMYQVSSLLSGRVKGMIQVAAAAPMNYLSDVGTSVSWAQGILGAAVNHPSLKEFMVKTGIRTWKALGQKKFRKLTFGAHLSELEHVMDPDSLREAQLALNTATKQGTQNLASDMLAVFSDFRSDFEATEIPVLVLHGETDPVFKIEAIRRFSHDYEDRITFVELDNAGFSAMATHTDQIVDHIKKFAENLD